VGIASDSTTIIVGEHPRFGWLLIILHARTRTRWQNSKLPKCASIAIQYALKDEGAIVLHHFSGYQSVPGATDFQINCNAAVRWIGSQFFDILLLEFSGVSFSMLQ
jgi:hypothetical protein